MYVQPCATRMWFTVSLPRASQCMVATGLVLVGGIKQGVVHATHLLADGSAAHGISGGWHGASWLALGGLVANDCGRCGYDTDTTTGNSLCCGG